jgi:hypothetical protein
MTSSSLLGPRGATLVSTPTEDAEVSRLLLATLRRNQSFGRSLKKAVRLGFVRLAKVIGSDDGKGNYLVEVVKVTSIQQRMK